MAWGAVERHARMSFLSHLICTLKYLEGPTAKITISCPRKAFIGGCSAFSTKHNGARLVVSMHGIGLEGSRHFCTYSLCQRLLHTTKRGCAIATI